ncbi:NAD(P)-binding protein [Aspergillus pseudotamarii]|uniref:NAD(P)-binding protein n=1 Tax=Aspergillus pseudotamarii TaxID=132259 RepID=A0A5N6SNT1_ASPPS|nr:NAD(P)-binding protein [Aspergillus pseudotamarii]KAE8136225.1 NAD(P)-binding protein [Aspergillus pseudotamarii]
MVRLARWKKFLISGGTGFVGAAIARALAEKHPECAITIIDRNPPGPVHTLPDGTEFIKVDVTIQEKVSKAIEQVRPDNIIHAARIVLALSERFGRRLEGHVWKTNVGGTEHILQATKQSGVKGFIYTSSCCVVTDQMSVPYHNFDEQWPTPPSSLIYGESKAAAEAIVRKESSDTMATCSLRPSVLCGPGDDWPGPAIHACIAKGETPFIVGDGQNLWDVTYVTNVADAHVLAAENLMSFETAAGEVFCIQNNEPITFRDLCLAIWAHFGHTPSFEIHIREAHWLIFVRDACSVRYASGEKAKLILGLRSQVGIETGVRLTCEDYARRMGIESPM